MSVAVASAPAVMGGSWFKLIVAGVCLSVCEGCCCAVYKEGGG